MTANLITPSRQAAKMRGLLSGAVGEEVGGDSFERVGRSGANVFVRVFEHGLYGWGDEARFGLKGGQRLEGQADGSRADIVEKIGEGRNDGSRLYVEVAKCVGSTLAHKVIRALQVSKEDRQCWSGVSSQFHNGQRCAGADAVMAIGQSVHQRRQRRRADVAKGGAREEAYHWIGIGEHLRELWNGRRTNRAKHLKGVCGGLLSVQIILSKHLEQVRDAISSNRAESLLRLAFCSAPRLSVLVCLEPGAQRLVSVAGLGSNRGGGERPSQSVKVAKKKDERSVPHVGNMPGVH